MMTRWEGGGSVGLWPCAADARGRARNKSARGKRLLRMLERVYSLYVTATSFRGLSSRGRVGVACLLLACDEGGPGAGLHVVENGRLPLEFRVCGEEGRDKKVFAAGVAGAGDEAHVFGHGRVHDFAGNSSAGFVGEVSPNRFPFFSRVFVAAETALIGADFAFKDVVVIGEVGFGEGGVELTEVLLDELLCADVAGIHAAGFVGGVEAGGVVADEVGIE